MSPRSTRLTLAHVVLVAEPETDPAPVDARTRRLTAVRGASNRDCDEFRSVAPKPERKTGSALTYVTPAWITEAQARPQVTPDYMVEQTSLNPIALKAKHAVTLGRAIFERDINTPVPYSREPKSIHSPAQTPRIQRIPPRKRLPPGPRGEPVEITYGKPNPISRTDRHLSIMAAKTLNVPWPLPGKE